MARDPVPHDAAAHEMGNPCAACLVRSFALCAALDPAELERLNGIMTRLEVGPHQTLFLEGDAASHVYNVAQGSLRLHKLLPDGRRQITGFLFPGDFLGLAVDEAYAYGAETVEAVQLCRFPRKRLEAMMQESPRLEKRLLGMASNELIEAQDQMLLLGRKTAHEKIASFLLMLGRRAVKRGEPSSPVELAMGRNDIADYLGLTTETVSRTFTQLKTTGLIRLLENSRVQLVDMARLTLAAQGHRPAQIPVSRGPRPV